jgi:4-amino-4-deoxy-L-arabinose transferase-like glycosyltransferase
VRLLVILAFRTYRLPTGFGFAFEVGSVAGSIAQGHGFSSPFWYDSGPTAWASPIYCYFLAGIFKTFGLYTNASALVAMIFDSLCSAFTCWAVFVLANKTFDRRIAVLAAWLWAFSPSAIHASTRYIWETCVSTLLLTFSLVLAVRMLKATRILEWVSYGAVWAFSALTNGAVLILFPFTLLWLLLRTKKRTPQYFVRCFWRLVIAGIAAAVVLTPWAIRNDIVFGSPMLRSGMGDALYAGMLFDTELGRAYPTHMLASPPEQKLYREMGESNYMAKRRVDAYRMIEEHPMDFVRFSVTRCLLFWFGDWRRLVVLEHGGLSVIGGLVLFGAIAAGGMIGLVLCFRRKSPFAWLYAIPFFTFPNLYYVTHVESRYRHPIEPVLIVLTAFAIGAIFRGRREFGENGASGYSRAN